MFVAFLLLFIAAVSSALVYEARQVELPQVKPKVVVVNSSVRAVQAAEVKGIARLLYGVCNQVWVQMRHQGCADADSPYQTWKFLKGYTNLEDAVTKCTPTPYLDCNYPERYGCYLLQKALSGGYSHFLSKTIQELSTQGLLEVNYYAVVNSAQSTSDPCAVDGTLIGEDR